MPKNLKTWLLKPVIVLAALGLSGTALLAIAGSASAATVTTPLQVTLSASSDGASAAFDVHGNILLTLGSVTASTFAQATITDAPGNTPPASEPYFATNAYNAGSPRWVIELANGDNLFGYPPNAGLNGSDFAWAIGPGCNPSPLPCYTNYSAVYAKAGGGSTTVTKAFIVADGDQSNGTTDTITDVQYAGAHLSPGVVTITNPGEQKGDVGEAFGPLQIAASTTTSDQALFYTLNGSVPAGLSIDPSTGAISGTPTVLETGDIVTVTVSDAYGDQDHGVCKQIDDTAWTDQMPPKGFKSQGSDCSSTQFEIDTVVAPVAPTPAPGSSSAPPAGTIVPAGGVQTGGGKASTSTLVPAGATGIGLGLLTVAFIFATPRRRARGGA